MPDPAWSRDRDAQAKRHSIAGRLLGPFGQARKETAATIQRRTSVSASASGQSPILRLRQWLDACNTQHGLHCCPDPRAEVATWRPPHLIDTVDRRLVRAKPTDRYAALSYVWGVAPRHASSPHATAQLLSSSLDAFQLSLPDAAIPRTFLDSIWLCKKLGLCYIWVDKLCIVQDDESDRADHVRHMASVFANAYLTIVAAHGDADTGLIALDPRRPSRTGREHADLELLYSRRAVFLYEDTVAWQCHCETWQGASMNVMPAIRGKRYDCLHRIFAPALCFQHALWPDMDEYARIAMDYSCQKLTLVDDTLPAFTGITHVLSHVFAGGFVYGMPLMFLDIALWRPQATIRRRALPRAPFLPSWSWMGWWFDGIPVDTTLWRASADYVEETRPARRGAANKRFQPTHSFRIKPSVVMWYLTDRMRTVPVANTGLHYRGLRSRRNASAALPPGWSRAGSHFRHDSDESTVFKYPIPVADEPPTEDGDEPFEDGAALPGPLLAFKTTSGFFEVDYAISMVLRDKPNPPIAVGNIWDRSNRWFGEFRAHDGWLGVQSSNYDGDEKIEFIAISTAMERRGSYVFGMDRFEENMDADEIIDIVNVLWVERISGVAYRRGIGHILQKAWEAEAVDEVEILLG